MTQPEHPAPQVKSAGTGVAVESNVAERLETALRDSKSANTVRVYRAVWKKWEARATERGAAVMSAQCQCQKKTPQKCQSEKNGRTPPEQQALGGIEQVVSLKELVVMHDLRRQGLSISAIARKTGLDRKTVRKHLERGLEVQATVRARRASG